eukprot:Ihof_evm2s674 gene=Ihof_evmTU2s674
MVNQRSTNDSHDNLGLDLSDDELDVAHTIDNTLLPVSQRIRLDMVSQSFVLPNDPSFHGSAKTIRTLPLDEAHSPTTMLNSLGGPSLPEATNKVLASQSIAVASSLDGYTGSDFHLFLMGKTRGSDVMIDGLIDDILGPGGLLPTSDISPIEVETIIKAVESTENNEVKSMGPLSDFKLLPLSTPELIDKGAIKSKTIQQQQQKQQPLPSHLTHHSDCNDIKQDNTSDHYTKKIEPTHQQNKSKHEKHTPPHPEVDPCLGSQSNDSDEDRVVKESVMEREIEGSKTIEPAHSVDLVPPSLVLPAKRTTNHLFYLEHTVMKSLLKSKDSQPFREPVDWVGLDLPDYLDVIEHPMDFKTINGKLQQRIYEKGEDCLADIRLVFSNCRTYNQPASDVIINCQNLEGIIRDKLDKMTMIEQELSQEEERRLLEAAWLRREKDRARREKGKGRKRGGRPRLTTRKRPSTSTSRIIPTPALSTTPSPPVMTASVSLPARKAGEKDQEYQYIPVPPVRQASLKRPYVATKEAPIIKRAKKPPTPKTTCIPIIPEVRASKKSRLPPIGKAMTFCRQVHRELMAKKYYDIAWPFYSPVDPIADGCSDYFDIIKHPMDLSTVKQKLDDRIYQTPAEFSEDMRRIFTNFYLYNPPDSPFYSKAHAFQDVFEAKFAHVPDDDKKPTNNIKASLSNTPSTDKRDVIASTNSTTKTAKSTVNSPRPTQLRKKLKEATSMSLEEKKELSRAINRLSPPYIIKVISIIQKRIPLLNGQPRHEDIQIDIDVLDNKTLKELKEVVENATRQSEKTLPLSTIQPMKSKKLKETLKSPAKLPSSSSSGGKKVRKGGDNRAKQNVLPL